MKDSNKKEEVKGITRGECYTALEAITTLLRTSSNMSGKASYALQKNVQKLKPIVAKMHDLNNKIIMKHCVKNKEGNAPEFTEGDQKNNIPPQVKYPNDDANQKAQAETHAMTNEVVDFKYHLMSYEEFGKMNIPTNQNPLLGVIVENVVDERTVPVEMSAV